MYSLRSIAPFFQHYVLMCELLPVQAVKALCYVTLALNCRCRPLHVEHSSMSRFFSNSRQHASSLAPVHGITPRPLRPDSKQTTSSMKMMDGEFSRAKANSWLTSFSLSPSHLLIRSWLLMLKNVLSASVATACIRNASLLRWVHHGQVW
jgi:hypothetical protein